MLFFPTFLYSSEPGRSQAESFIVLFPAAHIAHVTDSEHLLPASLQWGRQRFCSSHLELNSTVESLPILCASWYVLWLSPQKNFPTWGSSGQATTTAIDSYSVPAYFIGETQGLLKQFTFYQFTFKEGGSLEAFSQAAILKCQHCHRKAVVFNFMCPEPLRTCMIARSTSLAIPFPRCSGLGWYWLNRWPYRYPVP